MKAFGIQIALNISHAIRLPDSGFTHPTQFQFLGWRQIQFINIQPLHEIRTPHGKGLMAGTDNHILFESIADSRLHALFAETGARQYDRNDRSDISQETIIDNPRQQPA